MFTGLVQGVVKVISILPCGEGLTINFEWDQSLKLVINDGDSLSLNGICSTVLKCNGTQFSVDYLPETLAKTTVRDWREGHVVNVEPCLTLETPLGGHVVTGHVDGVGQVASLSYSGDFAVLEVAYPSEFDQYLISKGSISINGISLTVVDVTDISFTCHLIPHTIANTSLSSCESGQSVNLEFDMMAKYLYRFYECSKGNKDE